MSAGNVFSYFISSFFFLLTAISGAQAASVVRIVESSNERLVLEYTPELIDIKTVTSPSGETFLEPVFRNADRLPGLAGAPAFIGDREIIALPRLDGAKIVKIETCGSMIEKAGKLLPWATTEWTKEGAPKAVYIAKDELYSSDKREFAALTDFGMLGQTPVAHLDLSAVRWRADGFVQIPEKIRVTIKFEKGEKAPVKAVNQNSLFLNSNVAWKTSAPVDRALEGEEKLSDISSGNWFKIEISEEGVYRLDASYLSSKGINIPASDIETIKIFGEGGNILEEYIPLGIDNHLDEQEIIVNRNGSELGSIVFYGAPASGFRLYDNKAVHYLNPYTNNNYYILTWGGRPGKRATPTAPPKGEAVNFPTTYTHRIFSEEELVNPFDLGAGRTYFGKSGFDAPFIDVLQNLDRSGNVFYRIALALKSDTNGYFVASENQDILGKLSLGKSNPSDHSFATRGFIEKQYPASKIGADSRSVLSVKYTPSSTITLSTPYMDYYEIHYPRSFHALDGELSFAADLNMTGVTEFNVGSFSGEVLGFDATDKRSPKLLTNTATTGGMIIFKKDLKPGVFNQFYAASKFKTPASIQSTNFAGLRYEKSNADMIIVTPKEFQASAEKYAEYRAKSSSIKVKVVTTEQVYNEFASGVPDPTAIRDYFAHAFDKWDVKPTYAILWGDGHFDVKNTRTKKANYVPVWECENSIFDTDYEEHGNFYATDDYYARVSGEDLFPDIAIGRFNIESDAQGDLALEKVKDYENSSSKDAWRNSMILMADDGWNQSSFDGPAWTNQCEGLFNDHIPYSTQSKKIYLVEYPSKPGSSGRTRPGATDDLLSTINGSGASIITFIGHGNPRIWTSENVLRRDEDLPKMINKDKLFVAIAGTCEYGRFDNPDVNCGAEEMLLNPNGGAIATLAATRVVASDHNCDFIACLLDILFKRGKGGHLPSLGEAIRNAKALWTWVDDQVFYLGGDPALRLALPEYSIKIDSINGAPVDSVEFTELKGLAKAEIKARVLNPMDSTTLSDFNGFITLAVHDGDVFFVRNEDPPTGIDDYKYSKYGPVIARTSGKVSNGEAKIEFILPKDISFSEKTGRIFAYAVADDNRFASGETRKFKVTGIDINGYIDEKGPEIALYIDSRKFVPGDVVQASPTLIVDIFDESGINTTGLGVGHNIEAWLDDDYESINLNSKYESSIEDSRKGTAKTLLSKLTPGAHKIQVRAWDIFNNYGVADINFVVSDKDEDFRISGSWNYPNPSGISGSTIAFKHNLPVPFEAEIRIFNSVGSLVRIIKETATTALYSEILWDGKDDAGRTISTGSYYVQIIAGGEAIAGHSLIIVNN